ncbi:MAG: capsular polysaccharide biosynthesis protein [Ruminococcus flavefaciens]|nr:capsular polysaccharide biosynthesis protein [Ruminococcus flavefaciens]
MAMSTVTEKVKRKMMMIDPHVHILPGIDDGSNSAETSLKMLEELQKQGIERIIATPHFYAHREKSVHDFIEKRDSAFREIGSPENIYLGAEVAIEHGISEIPNIEELAIQGTDLILLEFSYTSYYSWMEEEIYNISVTHKLKPVIAHIHRYLELFSREQMERILKIKAVFQVNNEAFDDFNQKRFVKKLLREGYPVIFGSDSHNLSERKPNWNFIKRKVRQKVIDNAMNLLESHFQ